jgi:hypothetical protein
MRLLSRLRSDEEPRQRERSLADDARAMRGALDALHAELARVHGPSAQVDLRAMVRELLEGEVEAPTADVATLVRADLDPDEFYDKELQGSWEGLGESQRAARVEGFIELSQMMDSPGAAAGLPADMIPRVHTKTLLLAWAFDETYGYLSALGRGEG